jgi:hypothetical protein
MRRPMGIGKRPRRKAKANDQDPKQKACENKVDECRSNRHEASNRWEAKCFMGLVCVRVCRRRAREKVRSQDGGKIFTNVAGYIIQQHKHVHLDTRFDINKAIPVVFETLESL